MVVAHGAYRHADIFCQLANCEQLLTHPNFIICFFDILRLFIKRCINCMVRSVTAYRRDEMWSPSVLA